MRRIFLKNYFKNDQKLVINDDYFHYLRNVLRMKENEIMIVNFENENYEMKIDSLQKELFSGTILKKININNELPFDITIGLSLLKNDSFDLGIMKAVEFGTSNIMPLITTNCVVKIDSSKSLKKIEKYEKIALKSSIQSERLFVPNILDFTKLKNIDFDCFDYVFYASERKGRLDNINDFSNLTLHSKILILIGPEGGFTNEENAFLEKKCLPISLGKRILKAETACVYVLSCLSYLYE